MDWLQSREHESSGAVFFLLFIFYFLFFVGEVRAILNANDNFGIMNL